MPIPTLEVWIPYLMFSTIVKSEFDRPPTSAFLQD